MGQDLSRMGAAAWVSVAAMVTAMLWSGMAKAAESPAQEAPPVPRPTAEHKVLAEDVGTWDADVKTYMAGPDAPPSEGKATETNRLLAGGLWLLSDFTMSSDQGSFAGHGQFGYDPSKKKYVGTWIDSLSMSLMVIEGSYDARTKTITYTGEGIDPQTKSKFTQKMVTVTRPDGTRHFTLFMKFAGADREVKFMEVTYKKK